MIKPGLEFVDNERIERLINKFGDRFTKRNYTDYEIEICEHGNGRARFQRYSGYWAAKEAIMKALGTGNKQGVRFIDIETRHEESGKPYLILHGRSKEIVDKLKVRSMSVSISHEKKYSAAVVIFEIGD